LSCLVSLPDLVTAARPVELAGGYEIADHLWLASGA
jgi:hypothetical protein